MMTKHYPRTKRLKTNLVFGHTTRDGEQIILFANIRLHNQSVVKKKCDHRTYHWGSTLQAR